MGRVSRRELLRTAAGVGTVALGGSVRAQDTTRRVRVAAVQMHAVLGEVAVNLENAEQWVRLALREGAQWIVLPEFFTSAIALHPTKLVNAYRTLEGVPMQLLKTLAAEGRAFYAVPSDFYNCPIGSYTHAIDLPADRAVELEQVLGLIFTVFLRGTCGIEITQTGEANSVNAIEPMQHSFQNEF